MMLGIVSSSRSVLGPSPMSTAPRPAATQAMVQQPLTQGRVFVMTRQEALTSNAVVESMITLSGYIARTSF